MRVFLTSPWIPAEWIRAHGLEARGIWFAENFRHRAPLLAAGVCAFAESVVRFAETQPDSVVVFTTACDQLRRGFDAATFGGPVRAFLFNLPATQTPAARLLYRAELERLGQFLLELGGSAPAPELLRREMLQSDEARRRLRAAAPAAAARSYAQAVAHFHDDGTFSAPTAFDGNPEVRNPKPDPSSVAALRRVERNPKPEIRISGSLRDASLTADEPSSSRREEAPSEIHEAKLEPPHVGCYNSGIRISDFPPVPLALVGGPLSVTDWNLFDLIAAAGGRVVLNATQTGERSLCPDVARSAGVEPFPDPFDALATGYFENIMDVFQRPNTPLYSWLKPRLLARRARGIVLWHFTGCDLWRAEWQTLREVSGLPVLLLEADEAAGISPRDANRLQAFVEMLRNT